ncbi:MAG: sensor histidine kinase [Brotaphodocola sp.]
MKELNRLKARFVLFNMILVTVILLLALTGGIFLIRKQVQRESRDALARVAVEQPVETIFALSAYARIPYFSVVVGTDGEIMLMDGIYNSFQGDEFLEQVADLVEKSGLESGELKDYHLRFQRVSHPAGCLFVFADTSYEDSMQERMIDSMILICGGIWVCLLAVSCIFANWAVKPAKESILQQKQFVADASHELKTPLTVITANAELLSSQVKGLSADADKWIQNISQECREMRSLIESLLVLAKNDLQKSKDRCKDVCNLSELAEEEALTFEAVFFQNEKSITYQVEDDIQIYGSETWIRKLLGILLDNAVKYSKPHGMTEISLKHVGKKKVRLQVKSEGEPVPDAEKQAVFRRFYRSDRVRSSGQGFGLGLAIASEIVKQCGAKIGLETEPDGNCFFVIFRLKEKNEKSC